MRDPIRQEGWGKAAARRVVEPSLSQGTNLRIMVAKQYRSNDPNQSTNCIHMPWTIDKRGMRRDRTCRKGRGDRKQREGEEKTRHGFASSSSVLEGRILARSILARDSGMNGKERNGAYAHVGMKGSSV